MTVIFRGRVASCLAKYGRTVSISQAQAEENCACGRVLAPDSLVSTSLWTQTCKHILNYNLTVLLGVEDHFTGKLLISCLNIHMILN